MWHRNGSAVIFLTFLLSDGNKVMFLLAMLPNLKIKDISWNLNFCCCCSAMMCTSHNCSQSVGSVGAGGRGDLWIGKLVLVSKEILLRRCSLACFILSCLLLLLANEHLSALWQHSLKRCHLLWQLRHTLSLSSSAESTQATVWLWLLLPFASWETEETSPATCALAELYSQATNLHRYQLIHDSHEVWSSGHHW